MDGSLAKVWVFPSYFKMSTPFRILLVAAYELLWLAGYASVPDSWNIGYAFLQYICTFPVIFWALWGHWPWQKQED